MKRTSPMLLRQRLGAALRQHREARGETALEVARATGIHTSVISRLETGKRPPGLVYVRDLSRHYGLDKPTADQLLQVARSCRQPGWWEDLDLREKSAMYLGYEAGAASIEIFETTSVPGLLQTREYTEFAVKRLNPGISPERLEKESSARTERKKILTADDAVQFHAIISEAILHLPVGGRATLLGQLARLLDCSALPNVRLQVLRFTDTPSFGLDGSFALLHFSDDVLSPLLFAEAVPSDVAYAEGPLGAIIQKRGDAVSRCKKTFARLSGIALDEYASAAMIDRRMSQLKSE